MENKIILKEDIASAFKKLGIKSGMNIKIENPAQTGADLVVGSVAALREHKPPMIIVDMGTATTMVVLDKSGALVGGCICPGVKISLDALADVSGLSPSYISKLFHSETGITIAQYIQNKRIDAAKNLLIFTEYTTTDIANYLNFSSESYFINVFRRNCGLTPKKFRALHYRSNFVDKEDAEESIAQVK